MEKGSERKGGMSSLDFNIVRSTRCKGSSQKSETEKEEEEER